MSQAGMINTSSGPVPPTVPTTFTADTGTATPAANNINFLGNDTVDNDNDGITSSATGSTVTYLITNRMNVTSTTSDGAGQTQTTTLYTPSNSTAQTFKVTVNGYDSANNVVAGGELIGISRKSSGGVLTVVGTNDTFDESDTALGAVDWDVVSNGTALQMQFVGIAGRSITWRSLFEYIQTP